MTSNFQLESLQQNIFTKTVYTGEISLPTEPSFLKKGFTTVENLEIKETWESTIKKQSVEDEDINEFIHAIMDGEYGINSIYCDSIRVCEKIAQRHGLEVHDFIKSALTMRIFSMLGRPSAYVVYKKTENGYYINISYTDSAISGEIGANVSDYKVVVFHNEVTNLFYKSTLTDKSLITLFICNYETQDALFSRFSKIAYNAKLDLHYEANFKNVYYGDNSIIKKMEFVNVPPKTIEVSYFSNDI